jgi:hypothetical protein
VDLRAFDERLSRTLEDRRLSRAERRSIADSLAGFGVDEAQPRLGKGLE